MLQVHSLIQRLKDDPDEPFKSQNVKFVGLLEASMKFSLAKAGLLELGEVADYAELLMDAGLLRLPFPACYFEVEGCNDTPGTVGVLAFEPKGKTIDSLVKTLIFIKNAETANLWEVNPYCGGWIFGSEAPPGTTNVLESARVTGRPIYGQENADDDVAMIGTRIAAISIALMDLKEIDARDEPVSKKVNKARMARGKVPFFSHKTLTIRPTARAALATHVGPLIERRAHWRRGHLRHLPHKVVPVAPALVRGSGFVSKDYLI